MNLRKRKLKKIIWAFVWILPFILGTAGYCIEGEKFFDALYASFALYAINPVSDANNRLIIIAKWFAPFVLASGLLMILQEILQRIKESWIEFHKGATAIYCDNEYGKLLIGNMKNGILVKEEEVRDVDEHILFFSNDIMNLNFYQQNKEFFKGKKVYVKLNEIDSFLLRENTIHFFYINEIIARKYWQKHHLLPYLNGKNYLVKVAIVGFGELGQSLLNYGLLNNLYDVNQQIEYHVWGDSCMYEHSMQGMDLMNSDRIIYHGDNWREQIQQFTGMDRIIITDESQMELLQTFLYICNDADIHYFNPGSALLENIYKKEQLVSFGQYTDILTESNIKGDELYRAAKELNYKYACLYGSVSGDANKREIEMEEQWELLDGFTKGSNIASADYHEIRKLLVAKAKKENAELSMEQLGQMEHTRWCRFHYLNHWSYGVPENGKNKDVVHKIHVCLIPFEKMAKEDQRKDYQAVEVLLELMPV